MIQLFVDPASSSPPEAALAKAKGNPGDKSNEVQSNKGFRSNGCYKDTENRAIPSLEGKNTVLPVYLAIAR